jgi:hypothetical protein
MASTDMEYGLFTDLHRYYAIGGKAYISRRKLPGNSYRIATMWRWEL